MELSVEVRVEGVQLSVELSVEVGVEGVELSVEVGVEGGGVKCGGGCS